MKERVEEKEGIPPHVAEAGAGGRENRVPTAASHTARLHTMCWCVAL